MLPASLTAHVGQLWGDDENVNKAGFFYTVECARDVSFFPFFFFPVT